MLLPPQLQRGRNYTIQLGGVAGAGGPLDFSFEFFPDTRRRPDARRGRRTSACELPGIPAFGGCPPLVKAAARITVQAVPAAACAWPS